MSFVKFPNRWDAYPGVNGGVFLHDGLATGLETIHRVGDATLSNTDTVIFFESDCGINNVGFIYFPLVTERKFNGFAKLYRELLVMPLAFFLWISDRPLR